MKISVIAIYIWLLLQLNLGLSKRIEDLPYVFNKHKSNIAYVHGVASPAIYYWVSGIIAEDAVLAGFINKKCEKVCRVVVGAVTWEESGIIKMPIKRVINLNEEDVMAPQLSIVQFDQNLVYNKTVAPVALPTKRFHTGDVCVLFTWGEYKDLTDTLNSDIYLKPFEVLILKECGAGTFCFKLNNEKDKLDFCQVRSGPILCDGEMTGLVFFGGKEKCKQKLRATSVYDFINWIKAHLDALQRRKAYIDADVIRQGSSSNKISPNEMFTFYVIYSIICIFLYVNKNI